MSRIDEITENIRKALAETNKRRRSASTGDLPLDDTLLPSPRALIQSWTHHSRKTVRELTQVFEKLDPRQPQNSLPLASRIQPPRGITTTMTQERASNKPQKSEEVQPDSRQQLQAVVPYISPRASEKPEEPQQAEQAPIVELPDDEDLPLADRVSANAAHNAMIFAAREREQQELLMAHQRQIEHHRRAARHREEARARQEPHIPRAQPAVAEPQLQAVRIRLPEIRTSFPPGPFSRQEVELARRLGNMKVAGRCIHVLRTWRTTRFNRHSLRCQVCREELLGTPIVPHSTNQCFVRFEERYVWIRRYYGPDYCDRCGGNRNHRNHLLNGCRAQQFPFCNSCHLLGNHQLDDHFQWSGKCQFIRQLREGTATTADLKVNMDELHELLALMAQLHRDAGGDQPQNLLQIE